MLSEEVEKHLNSSSFELFRLKLMQMQNLECWQFCLETNGVNIGKWCGASTRAKKD